MVISGRRFLRAIVGGRGLVGAAILMASFLAAPGTASAGLSCTDIWTGGAGDGLWQSAGNWSSGKVPGTSDAACIGSGVTVKVTAGSDVASALEDLGSLEITGGSLALSDTAMASSVSALVLSGGVLTGAGSVIVSGSLSWTGDATMSGAGSTVLGTGASGEIEVPAGAPAVLEGRALVNEGTLTFAAGTIAMSDGARIENAGTFAASSETSSSGGQIEVPSGSGGAAPSIVNTGTFVKSAGTGTTTIGVVFDNAGAVEAHTGHFSFAGGEVQKSPQGAWAGNVGAAGYVLAGWHGASEDVSYLPHATLSLVHGARFRWAQGTSDVRALEGPAGTLRNAGTFYGSTQLQAKLSFDAAYSGDLHLYAVDWDSTARRESIVVEDGSGVARTVTLSSAFNEGAWVSLPVSVAAGGAVTITVNRLAGSNAVLSGIFLGDEGAPPEMPVSRAPEGDWVGAYGVNGYDLFAWDGTTDLASLPDASVSLIHGSRFVWTSSTTGSQALESPDGSAREATTLYDSNEIQLQLEFTAAYTGDLNLYAVDWDARGRRELITVDGQTAELSSDFSGGAWVSFPISVPAGGVVTITVDRTATPNAVLSGIFLGSVVPPASTTVPSISGAARDGQTLGASPGAWEGTTPLSYSYQWQSCSPGGGECQDIEGATSSTYLAGHGDVGSTLRVVVTATNSAGSFASASVVTPVVAALAPSNTTPPVISGAAEAGQALTASAGSWEGTPTISYAYQWQRCDSHGEGCTPISGATSSSYTSGSGEVGMTLRALVTASNAAGSASAVSGVSGAVASSVPPHLSYAFEFGFPGSGEGRFEDPADVALDGHGDLWVLDRENNRVQELNEAGEYLQQLGSEGAGDGQMERPSALAVNAEGDVWVLDSLNDRIEELNEDGVFVRASENVLLEAAEGMAIAPNGDIWVAATGRNQLVVFNRYGQLLKVIGGQGSGPGELFQPIGIAVVGGHVWVTEWRNDRVQELNEAGEYIGEIKNPGMEDPAGIAVSGGHVYVGVVGSQRVWVFNEDGRLLEEVGRHGSGAGQFEMDDPMGIAVNSVGDMWVTDEGNDRVQEWTPEDGELAAPVNTSPPSISGAAGVGQTLLASPGAWDGSPLARFAYQWERCDAAGGDCVAIEGATRSTYVPAQGEIGSTLRVLVTATNSSGSALSVSPVTAVVGVPPEDLSTPTVAGTAQDGETLSAGTGVWEGSAPIAYAYQWQRCLEGDFEGAEAPFNLFDPSCEDIEGATGSSYTLRDADVETVVRVIVTASDANGETSAASQVTAAIISPAPPENIAAPTVSGAAEEGQTLEAGAGEWRSVGRVSYAYQWQRCNAAGEECANIEGATDATYVPEAADLHGTLRVTVIASNGAGSADATSRPSEAVAQAPLPANTAAPAIAGLDVDGQTLTVSTGTWGGAQQLSYAYQWESCNPAGQECAPVEGATEAEYAVRDGDIGSTLRALVTATNAGGSAQATSAASPVIEVEAAGEREAPSISGTPDEHEVLYADTGVWSGSEVRVSYQWESCDPSGAECAPVQGATDPEYDLTEGDVGTTLRLRVGAASRSVSLTDVSAPTPVIGAPGALASTSPPSISGTPRNGEPLSASNGGWSGAGSSLSYAYQWQRCDAFGASCQAITGAGEAGYTPTTGDAGHALRVLVTASAEGHQAGRLSAATQPVAAAEAPVVEQSPSIQGTALTSYTLSADTGAWSGEGRIAYTYQWERCTDAGECAPIEGATKSAYTLVEADRGSRVRVVVTAEGPSGSATAISDPTADIEPQPLVQFSLPSISGAVQDEATLSAEAGIWSGSGPVSYAYQWESCNPAGSECAPIEGATEDSYTIGDGDQGSTLRVDVTVTNPQGSASTSSATTLVVPGGELSAEAALEVAQQTDPATFAPATTASIEEQAIAPMLQEGEEELASQGTLTSSSVSKETAGEFAVNTPAGELSLTPIDSLSTATNMPTLVNEAAALFANTWPATDTIIRPEPLGASAILQIRSAEAPRSFSWEVGLGPDQRLEQLSDGGVAVTNVPEDAGLPGEEEQPSGTPDTEAGQPETAAEEAEAEKEETESKEAEAKGETEAELPTEPLPPAPLASTPPAESVSGESQPQDTQAQYETAAGAMSSAETQSAGQALMVIPMPAVVDATGDSVPASLSVTGDTVTLTIKPGSTITYPAVAELSAAAPTDKVSAERDPIRYGLSDEKASTFAKEENGKIVDQSALDPSLQGTGTLKVTTARKVVPYNVFSKPNPIERPRLIKWLEAVKIAGLQPYVTLGPNQSCHSSNCYVPSRSEYLKGFTDLVKDEPGVKLWGAWNEPDIGEFPLSHHAHRAAEYWQEAQYVVEHTHNCGCKMIAGEFAFAGEYRGRYISEYRETIDDYKKKYPPCHTCTHSRPQVWGFHDYKDVEDRNSAFADRFNDHFLGRKSKARVWIGEAGVELQPGAGLKRTELAEGSSLAEIRDKQRAAAKEFEALHNVSSRFERIYYYSYNEPSQEEQANGEKEHKLPFDSGLLSNVGEARPVYCVLLFSTHECPAPTVGAQSGVYAVKWGQPSEPKTEKFPFEAPIPLTGSVDPNGSPVSYEVEHGPTTAYGHHTQPVFGGAGSTPSQVVAWVNEHFTHPESHGTEHFRIVAHSGGSAYNGSDATEFWAASEI